MSQLNVAQEILCFIVFRLVIINHELFIDLEPLTFVKMGKTFDRGISSICFSPSSSLKFVNDRISSFGFLSASDGSLGSLGLLWVPQSSSLGISIYGCHQFKGLKILRLPGNCSQEIY